MKCKINKIIQLCVELDSSEAVMFNKGGMFKCQLPSDLYFGEEREYEEWEDEKLETNWDKGTYKIMLTFQMDRNEKSRFDHVTDYKYCGDAKSEK